MSVEAIKGGRTAGQMPVEVKADRADSETEIECGSTRDAPECPPVVDTQSPWPAISFRGGAGPLGDEGSVFTLGFAFPWRYYFSLDHDNRVYVTGGPDFNLLSKDEGEGGKEKDWKRVGGQVGVGYHRFRTVEAEAMVMIHQPVGSEDPVQLGVHVYVGVVDGYGIDGHFASLGFFGEYYPDLNLGILGAGLLGAKLTTHVKW